MSCLCPTNTLRSFIRSIAHIDLSANSTRLADLKLRQNSIRRLPARRVRYSSTVGRSASYEPSPTQPASAINSTQLATDGSNVRLDSFFAEISPEDIDALAAEHDQTTPSDRPSQYEQDHSPLGAKTFQASGSSRKAKAKGMNQSPKTFPRDQKSKGPGREQRGYNLQRGGQDQEPSGLEDDWKPARREPWQIQKSALKEKFEGGWQPMKKLSPDALAGIRALHSQMPDVYTTAALADNFQVSPEAIRRILKSKWTPGQEEEIDRQKRWFKRGEKVWTRWAEEEKMKPPKRWRELGVGKGYFGRKKAAAREAEERTERFAYHIRAATSVTTTATRPADTDGGPGN
ncbi:hypothetical protein BP6252_03391 [Coleophoma cylindrospora]|uniref:Required for respiratory growth protein 9, mitochondrial n=1 Tax=Coleophoma cylindrospora TaxID=1849047 RepID=A0A3D8S7K3_9HELO|nr:hypothetical protein BP6252_03391 [Coleophoma cylindrospora]